LALITWKDRLFVKVKERLLNALLDLIKQDRDGEQVNQTLIYGVIQSYGWLKVLLVVVGLTNTLLSEIGSNQPKQTS
jgi:hypothetical protein